MYSIRKMHLRMSSAEWQPICVSLILLTHDDHLDNLLVVEDCSNSIANALELPQYCTKPSIYWPPIFKWVALTWTVRHCTSTTDDISIDFEIRSKCAVLWFKMYSTDHNIILHMLQQCYSHDVCKILLWSADHIMNKSITKFHWISNSIEISLVRRAHGGHSSSGLGSIPFFQFNSNTFNSNSFGMKNNNSNSFLSIPIPFYQFFFNSFLKPN